MSTPTSTLPPSPMVHISTVSATLGQLTAWFATWSWLLAPADPATPAVPSADPGGKVAR